MRVRWAQPIQPPSPLAEPAAGLCQRVCQP